MSTVGAVIDRIYRTYLQPPDAQPPLFLLGLLMDDSTTSMTAGAFAIPEDEQLLRVGVLVEAGRELMRVTAYNATTKVLTVQRGVEGTTAAEHLLNAKVTISPPYPRQSVFEQVRENITSLSPRLYTVRSDALVHISQGVYGVPDSLALHPVRAFDDAGNTVDIQGQIIDFHRHASGRAFIAPFNGNLWLTWRRRMGVATAETDTLADLGVDEQWTTIIMAGVAADLMSGRDISAAHVEWVTRALAAERIQVGTRQSIGAGLAQLRDYLLERFAKEMDAEYKPKVRMRDPFESRVRGRAFG